MPTPPHINSGVGLKTWLGPTTYVTRPASPVLARFYRSVEGYTYTQPRVVLGGSPVSVEYAARSGYQEPGWAVFASGAPANANLAFYNHAAILLKRVSSTTWMELRWNALSNAAALTKNATLTNAPWAFELWCSHNASGTLSTTRLATWDYSSTDPASVGNVPFDPLTLAVYLEAEMIANVVTWGLWSVYPGLPSSPSPLASRIENGSYSIPSGLQSTIGTAVAGSCGVSLKVDNPSGSTGTGLFSGTPATAWDLCAGNPPFVHYMEFVDAVIPTNVAELAVIGDVDTAPVITLLGRLVDPAITFTIVDEDGVDQVARVALAGTIDFGEQVTIDLGRGGSVTDAQGVNRYGMLQPGSRLPMLGPGVNKVSLSASDWNTALAEHIVVTWRDARV